MILYLDACALVKRYVTEPGAAEVAMAIAKAEAVGTSLISRAETEAALAKAVRVGTLSHDAAASTIQVFRNEWPAFVRVLVTELIVSRAGRLAWELGLRGYDAVHLSSALQWQDSLSMQVTMATFDRQLWKAASQCGLQLFPTDLPSFLESW